MKIDATNINYNLLNEQIKNAIDSKIIIENCEGQRNIAKFSKEKEIEIYGTTGNALGSFMESGSIEVFGDVQDVVGENMKDGKIIVHGSAGSSCGYAMKGGAIYIENNAGYRTGMYMKEYKNNESVIIIGNDTGSYLGEKMESGTIVVLGLNTIRKIPVGRYCATGMNGGRIFLRCDEISDEFSETFFGTKATQSNLAEIRPYLNEFCKLFDVSLDFVMSKDFYLLEASMHTH